MRDNQTDTRSAAAVAYTMDFRPTTLAEEAAHNGVLRVNAPVGAASTDEYVNPFSHLRGAEDISPASGITKNQRW
jgi:hypothetical protein